MKKCFKCKIKKDYSLFSKNRSRYDGYNSLCKECDKIPRGDLEKIKKHQREHKKKIRMLYPEKEKEIQRRYYIKNSKKHCERQLEYYYKNRDTIRERRKRHNKKPLDILGKLKQTLRSRLCRFMRETIKGKRKISAVRDIGCTMEELKKHLEGQFKPGMTWENYGFRGWHIDHIIPLSSAKTQEDLYKLCHFSNLQPLWAKDNFKKAAKYDK